MSDLAAKHCVACEGGVEPLNAEQVKAQLAKLQPGWQADSNNKIISRDFEFRNYYFTMAFVNAIAWMANKENHHPDLEVGFNHCKVNYSTHAIDGLSENDFICAAKVDRLFLGE